MIVSTGNGLVFLAADERNACEFQGLACLEMLLNDTCETSAVGWIVDKEDQTCVI